MNMIDDAMHRQNRILELLKQFPNIHSVVQEEEDDIITLTLGILAEVASGNIIFVKTLVGLVYELGYRKGQDDPKLDKEIWK